MSIVRINTFKAQKEKGDELLQHIKSFVPFIESSNGCVSCRVLRNMDSPETIVVIEVWKSVESHKESVQAIPPDALEKAKELMAGPATGEYYEKV